VLDGIRTRGQLRVGYLPNALPIAFFNGRDELVGFDIDLAHRLAEELKVRLELIPITRDRLSDDLARGYYDIVMSGIPVTTDLASLMLMSNPYVDETLAFIVPDQARERFSAWDGIRSMGPITIAVPELPYYVEKLRVLAPNATLRQMPDLAAALESAAPDIHAIAMPAERGSAWTLMYPAYSVVVPEPGVVKVPLAFPVARQDQAFAAFVNAWIELKRKDATLDALHRYWILGHDPAAARARWSIIRNVLHWVE
jgi:ABC-type amino acid transport substrate-binding protein